MHITFRTLAALAATALAVAACGGDGRMAAQPPAPNAPPALAAIGDQTINQDMSTAAIPFDVSDDQTAAASLTVTASSSDETLISNEGITLAGSGGSRTVMVTPAEAAVGSAMVSLTVADSAGLSATRSFRVTVNAVNVPFTPYAFDTFADPEGADARSLLGFTLNNDSDDRPDAFDPLF